MAVSLVGTPTSAGGSTTVNKPTGTTSGDLLVLFMGSHGATTAPTPPSGWTSITTNTNAQGWSTAAAYKVAGASEPTSYTWTAGTGFVDGNDATIVRCQGQDSTTQIDGSSVGSGTSGTISLSAITASVAGDALLVYSADWTDIGVSTWPLSGSTLLNDLAGSDQEVGDATGLASGSTGAMSVVYNAGSGGSMNLIAVLVKSAAGGGGTAWNQALTDAQSALDTRLNQAQKRPSEFLSALDTLTKAYTSSQSEKFSSLDAALKAAQHRLTGDTTSATDSTQRARGAVQNLLDAISSRETATRSVGKGLFEGTSALDSQSNRAGKALGDQASSLDNLQRAPTHLVSGDVTSATDLTQRARGSVWTIVDALSGRDSITQHAVSKFLGETLSSLDTTRFATTHLLAETFITLDVLSKLPSHLLSDIFSSTDSVTETKNAGAVAWAKTLTDTQSATDVRLAAVLKTLGETQSAQDLRTALVLKVLGENLVLVDSSSWQTVHRIVDSLSATDKFVAGKALLLALQEWFSSTDVSSEVKQQALAQGHLAVLSLTISMLLGVHLAISTSASVGAVVSAISLALHATLSLANALQSQRTISSAFQVTLSLR